MYRHRRGVTHNHTNTHTHAFTHARARARTHTCTHRAFSKMWWRLQTPSWHHAQSHEHTHARKHTHYTYTQGLFKDVVEITDTVVASAPGLPVSAGDLYVVTCTRVTDSTEFMLASFHGDTNGACVCACVRAASAHTCICEAPAHARTRARTYRRMRADVFDCGLKRPNPLQIYTHIHTHAHTHIHTHIPTLVHTHRSGHHTCGDGCEELRRRQSAHPRHALRHGRQHLRDTQR